MKIFRVIPVALLVSLLATNPSYGIEPRIHTVVRKGTVFRHFELELSAPRILLSKNIQHRPRLDNTAEQFKYGQFEIFIPVKYLKLPLDCKSNYIVRMPQSDDEDTQEIKRKRSLYYAIDDVKQGRRKAVRVALEMTDSAEYTCNLFFRSDAAGRYIDYVGQVKP